MPGSSFSSCKEIYVNHKWVVTMIQRCMIILPGKSNKGRKIRNKLNKIDFLKLSFYQTIAFTISVQLLFCNQIGRALTRRFLFIVTWLALAHAAVEDRPWSWKLMGLRYYISYCLSYENIKWTLAERKIKFVSQLDHAISFVYDALKRSIKAGFHKRRNRSRSRSRSRSLNQKRRETRSRENQTHGVGGRALIVLMTPSLTIKWKLLCRSRKRKPKNKQMTMFDSGPCD